MFKFVYIYIYICRNIYVKMNCIILNSFPIMFVKGGPLLATFLRINGSLLDQLSDICIYIYIYIYLYIYIYINIYLSLCPFEISWMADINHICHITPYIL